MSAATSAAVRFRRMNDAHNKMMTKATVLYARMDGEIERSEMDVNRVEIAEALVGEWKEKTFNRRTQR